MTPTIETTPVLDLTPCDLKALVEELGAYHALYSPLFQGREQREQAAKYLQGLLLELPRKSIEPLVLALEGGKSHAVRAMQQFISKGSWDDTALLHRHWQEVERDLGEDDGVLILDGSDFPTQGLESVGVKRQYCGELGKRANGQAGVCLGYANRQGYTLLDRRLYLPQAWVAEATSAGPRRRCGVPREVTFTTKPMLGWEMIHAVQQAKLLRCRWVGRTIKEGSKGPLVARFARRRVVAVRDGLPGPDVWLVLRHHVGTGALKTDLSNAPAQNGAGHVGARERDALAD